MAQRRQMRSDHPDSKNVFTLFKYLKELAVKFQDHTMMIYADGKTVTPVGEPCNIYGCETT